MDEVCEIFSITPPTIYDWIKHGKLKPKKIRSRVFFLWNDIQELLYENIVVRINPGLKICDPLWARATG